MDIAGWQVSKSAVCETRSPYCWKYKASPCPRPCVRSTPCSPCRPPCTLPPPCPSPCSAPCSPCPPPVDRCRRTPDDCCARERFSSSCSAQYSPPVSSVCCKERQPCYPRERFASSCSSPGQQAATRPDVECAPCDLSSYCIKSSPISCNPCLGRRSFRHCSSFTRPSVSYRDWCYQCVDEDSRRSPSRTKSRKPSGIHVSRSASILGNENLRHSSSSTMVVPHADDPNKQTFLTGKGKNSRQGSRKSTRADSARRSSSRPSKFGDDGDIDEDRKSSSARESRKSSRLSAIVDKLRRSTSRGSSVARNDDDDDRRSVDADRRRSSSVASAPRASSPQRSVRNSSASKHSSRSSGVGRKLSSLRARFSSKAKLSSLKRIFRKRKTTRRSTRPASASRSSSSRSSVNRNERKSSSRASVDNDEDEERPTENKETDCADLVKPLAECIAGAIQKSVTCQDSRYCGQMRTASRPPCSWYEGRCSPRSFNPRDRFSLYGMPYYRSGHRVFTGTTRRGASVVAFGDRQSHASNAEFVPDAQNVNRRTSTTAMRGGQMRSSSSRAVVPTHQDAAFISSMPPPGTSFPRPTITGTNTGTSSRQLSAAPRPPFAGYREHYVTTTNQTVHVTQDQNFNYTGSTAARRSSEGSRRGVDNRNQSGATSAGELGVSSDNFPDDVFTDTRRRTTSSPALAPATARSDRTPGVYDQELGAMFEETERGIMEAFDNGQQVLR